ncbi:MAG: aminopeptidase [Bacteroidetes bacterium]|nr:aminopeptidase [Bacteroidota bacterium]
MKLLEKLCQIQAPSGSEHTMQEFLLDYIKKNSKNWDSKPKVITGPDVQNAIILVFGKPKTAIFAHMDSIGFTVRYGKELVKIGGPKTENGYELVGEDTKGPITCKLQVNEKKELSYKFNREIERGTTLTFKPNFRETKEYVQTPYLDNRLGVWNALQVAQTLKNGIICFSCWEEHGGGNAEVLGKYIYERYKVSQALISDITWITEGVVHNKGVAISIRDSGIPRRMYVNKIIELAKKSKIPFQLEVESAGGSDGNALQRTPYPFDWCFIGAAESFVHSPDEKVHKNDIQAMVEMYSYLMKKL